MRNLRLGPLGPQGYGKIAYISLISLAYLCIFPPYTMISVKSSAHSLGYNESEGPGNMKNQWVMDDFDGALGGILSVS